MEGPSPFPPGDSVRVETAACLRRCMLNGTTPPVWVLQMVMPASAGVVNGATAAQMGEVRGVSVLSNQNIDVAFAGAANTQNDAATPIQQSNSSDSSSPSPLDPASQPQQAARTSSAVSAPANARPQQPVRTTSAVAPPAPTSVMQPARTSSAVSEETTNNQSTRNSTQPIDHGFFVHQKDRPSVLTETSRITLGRRTRNHGTLPLSHPLTLT